MQKNEISTNLIPSALDQFAETGGILGLVILGFFLLIGLNMYLRSKKEGKDISDVLVSIQQLRAELYRSGVFADRRDYRHDSRDHERRRRDD